MIAQNLNRFFFILIELFHTFVFLLPTLIYFGFIKSVLALKFSFFVIFFTPLHWVFFDDKCILDVIAGFFDKRKAERVKTGYYHRNLFFIIKPLSKYFSLSIQETIHKLLGILLLYNAILLWHFIFFKKKCKLK